MSTPAKRRLLNDYKKYQKVAAGLGVLIKLKANNIDAWINKHSITVVFPRPSDEMVKKWSLATEDDISHVVVMQHVTKEILSEFIDEYMAEKKNE